MLIRKELKKYPKKIEILVEEYYEKTNPIYSKEELIKDYLLLVAIYILHINKYSYPIKRKFLDFIKENAFSQVNFEQYDVYELLFNDYYLFDFMKSNIPINKNLINNYAIYEFLDQQNIFYPLVIDPVGLFCACFKMKNKEEKWSIEIGHLDSKTYEIIEEALEKGRKLIIKDFDSELLSAVMPILVWKKEKVMKKIMEMVYLNNLQNFEVEENINFVENEINFNGKVRRVHADFHLVLVLTETNEFLSQSLLSYVILINNDLGDNEIWNETILDLIIKKYSFSKDDNNKNLFQMFEDKLNNKLSLAYKKFLKSMKEININEITLEVFFI